MKYSFRSVLILLCLGLTCFVSNVMAESWTDRTLLSGFLSARYSKTDEAAFLNGDRTDGGINEDGSFQGTKLGLNISSRVTDQLTVATQLFSTNEGSDSYHLTVDWAFASFMLNQELSLRTGKIKYPVGLVNEYVDVGATYPWIQPPLAIYSESGTGPQATREAYTGYSLLWSHEAGDWLFDTDLFAGQVDLTGMTIKKMLGLTARANWNDTVQIQASSYSGDMFPDDPTTMMGMMMNEKEHKATLLGVSADWNNVVFYTESATVKMDARNMMNVAIMDSDSWYATLGYRLGKWLPHYTYQDWEQDSGYGHTIKTLGINYRLSSNAVVKLESSKIDTDKFNTANAMQGNVVGLFNTTLTDESTNLYSMAVDVVF